MSNVHRLPDASKRRVTTTEENGEIVVRFVAPSGGPPPNELVSLAESGLEGRAWRALVRSGELPARCIGRRWYTTRSALVALVLDAPKRASKTALAADYAALVASARGSR